MSEDQYWAADVLRAGYEVVYHPSAQVLHSHNYSVRTVFHRNWLSGASLTGLIADSPLAVGRRGLKYVTKEAVFLVREGRAIDLPYMFAYEMAKSIGFAFGSAGWSGSLLAWMPSVRSRSSRRRGLERASG
jgi:rhamnosyltransferase